MAIGLTSYQEFYTNFLNHFYDDEGWWALAWIKAYDLTQTQEFLQTAEFIFQDMTQGWDGVFGGGIYWGKRNQKDQNGKPYKNAIANELFMAVGARLYLRTANEAYKGWALKEYAWFYDRFVNNYLTTSDTKKTNSKTYLIRDALNPATGWNDGTQTIWTYNQGVILGALCDLTIITGDPAYRELADQIAAHAITHFSDPNGILLEGPLAPPSPTSDYSSIDHCQFKGVFIRNLATLFTSSRNPAYSQCINKNAASVVANANASHQIGAVWSRSPTAVDFIRQTAGIDAINAANRVAMSAGPISLKKVLAQVGQRHAPLSVRKAVKSVTSSVRGWSTTLMT